MPELKPRRKKTVKKVKPQVEKQGEEPKEDDSWEDFLNDESFNEGTDEKKVENETIDVTDEIGDEGEIQIDNETEEEGNNNMAKEEEKKEDIKAKVGDIKFPVLERTSDGKKISQDMFGNIPIEVTVELGRTSVSLKDIYELNEGSIIELERLAGEPLDLVVNGQIVAHGEVVAVDDNYGLRIIKILTEQ